MVFLDAILAWLTVEPRMGADPIAIEEYFNNVFGYSHIHFMPDVLMGDGVVHFLDCYAIIELYGSDLPNRYLVLGSRQWHQ